MIITITGPTCSGKTTIEVALQRHGVHAAISHTTRPMRPHEIDGEDYHFVTAAEFQRLADEGAFVEQVEFGGNRYAVSAAELRGGKVNCVVVEPHGATQVLGWARENRIPTLAVWVDCGPKEQAKRFIDRVAGGIAMTVGRNDGRLAQSIASNTGRLAEMLSTEQQWRDDANRGITQVGGFAYNLMLQTQIMTPLEAASAIVNSAHKMQKLRG